MKRACLCLLFLFALPALAAAQAPSTITPPVTAVRLVISGGVSPVTNDLPLSALSSTTSCVNPTGTVPNPTGFQYKINTGDTNCWKYTDPGNGPLLSLPIGGTTYTATLAYVNSNGAGPASAVSNPFSRPGTVPTVAPVILLVVP